MRVIHLLAACFVLFSLVLVGCNRDAGKPKVIPAKDDSQQKHADLKDHKDHKGEKKGDGHAHKPAAHGGTIVSVGTDNYHAEVVFEKDGHLKLYMLGKDETKGISIESQTLKAHAKHDEKSHEMDLKPEPQASDAKGKTSLFVGKLPHDLIGKKVTVTVVGLKVEGETFRVEFSGEAGKHGDHKDHKDEKEHKDHKKDGKEHKDHKKDGKEHKDHKKDHSKAKAIENEIKEARAMLSPEDRKLVDAQEWCPVMTENRLGEMGVPFKIMIGNDERQLQPVFLCCKGCRTKALANQDKTLAKVEEFKKKVKTGAVKVGDKVPDFSIAMLDGKTVKLSDLQKDEKRTKKGVVVLSFWCTTCHSCRHVDAQLAKLAKDYDGQAAVIALDANADDTAPVVTAFVKKSGVSMPVALDPNASSADLFGIKVTTTTVVIDGNGVLRYCGQFRQKGGASAEDALKAVLAGNEVALKMTPHKG